MDEPILFYKGGILRDNFYGNTRYIYVWDTTHLYTYTSVTDIFTLTNENEEDKEVKT
jgi:hypothetical protein